MVMPVIFHYYAQLVKYARNRVANNDAVMATQVYSVYNNNIEFILYFYCVFCSVDIE